MLVAMTRKLARDGSRAKSAEAEAERRLVERLDWAITDYARCLPRSRADRARPTFFPNSTPRETPGVSAKDISHPLPISRERKLSRAIPWTREIQLALSTQIFTVARKRFMILLSRHFNMIE